MFVAPWSPDFEPDAPPITSALVTAEFRGIPYLFYNKQSLSRVATAVGKPIALAPETERKETFEVAKVLVRVDLTKALPAKLIVGIPSGREYEVSVSYPWLPPRCLECNAYGHERSHCKLWLPVPLMNRRRSNRSRSRPQNNRRSRQGCSPAKEWKVKDVSSLREAAQGPNAADDSKASNAIGAAEGVEGTISDGKMVGHVLKSVVGSVAEVVLKDGESISSGLGSVVVELVEGSSSEQMPAKVNEEIEAPFILVSRRKSGRKVTLSR